MKLIHFLILIPFVCIWAIYFLNKVKFKKNKMFFIFYMFFVLSFIISFIFHTPVVIFLFYTIVLFIIFDILIILFEKLKLKNLLKVLEKVYLYGVTPLFLALIMTIYGIYNAHHYVINTYNFMIDKSINENIRIGFVSDIHLGTSVRKKDFNEIISMINKSNVDVLILGGDIFDENTIEVLKDYAYEKFKDIKTKYGVYYIEGNHDLLTDKVRNGLESSNIVILEDEDVLINNSYYLVGRRDYKDPERKDISLLVKDLNKNYPIILLDHQPRDSKNASINGVDLQLSGHTHNGQIYPLGYFQKNGLEVIGNYKLFTSSGIGTWGFPVRTQGDSELLIINLSGK